LTPGGDAPPVDRRRSIGERAASRDRVEAAGGDRYQNLLEILREGRPPARDETRRARIEWHPIARKLLLAALVAAVVWAVGAAAATYWRQVRVETWSGPDASVTSGQQLASCPVQIDYRDPVFPTWVRFEGKVYAGLDQIRPVGSGPSAAYPSTGYRLGDLELLRIANSPAGRAGETVLLKLVSVGVGELYGVVEGCS
jgi:hypothetical protein